jgi:hypothetical protein
MYRKGHQKYVTMSPKYDMTLCKNEWHMIKKIRGTEPVANATRYLTG